MLKKTSLSVCIAAALLCALGAQPAQAQAVRKAGNVGIGIGSGTLASLLSLKYFPDSSTALQFNLGVHNTRRSYYGDAIALGFDYLLEQPSFGGSGGFEVAWNIGPGVSLGLADGRYANYWIVGVSGVIGLEFLINVIPIDIVLEYRPTIFLFNDNFNDRGRDGFDIDLVEFGAHIRYFF